MVLVENDKEPPELRGEPEAIDQTRELPAVKLRSRSRRKNSAKNFPPRLLDKKYKLVRELGSGSMGQVYVYRDLGIDREVAIKFQRESDEESASRFHTEARIAASLQHPNVVTVFADGEFEKAPYIVFEYLDGQSLDKLDSAMPWTEVRKLGLQLASGLAAVHRAGLLHRDIKPANAMLLDKSGQRLVKLIDFGVAKSTDAANRFGGATGTPRYMAPEVWDNAAPTERSDVYSLGLTLYQLCTGRKPPIHPYDEDIRLDRPEIDSAFASVVNRCLERNPSKRYASGSELYNALLPLYSVKELLDIDVQQWIRNERADGYLWAGRKLSRIANLELENLPDSHREFLKFSRARVSSASWRKRMLAGLMVLAVLGVYIGVRYANRAALKRKVRGHIDEARALFDTGRERHQEFDQARERAIQELIDADDQDDQDKSIARWEHAVTLEPHISKAYSRAGQQLEVALALDGSRADVKKMLADVLEARARLANDIHRNSERDEFLERLGVYDKRAHEVWLEPTQVSVESRPQTRLVTLAQYKRRTDDGALDLEVLEQNVTTPFSRALGVGSYVLILGADNEYPEIRYPFLVRYNDEPLNISIARPRKYAIPENFIFIPEGRYYYGYGSRMEDEELREFYISVPMHQRTLSSYLIQRSEVTYREWIAFLRDTCLQPGCSDRPALIPDGTFDPLAIKLSWTGDRWRFSYKTGDQAEYVAVEGAKLVHTGRQPGDMVEQDWLDFPVSGITPAAVHQYLTWLRVSHRVRGARLCTEFEWERAARGADMRTFPHGDTLEPHHANIDVTHGKNAHGAGPDVVGSHPESASPFGVEDMTGNVWELTRSMLHPAIPGELTNGPLPIDAMVIRGGCFYQDSPTGKLVNRWIPPAGASPLVGLRVCADAPATTPSR